MAKPGVLQIPRSCGEHARSTALQTSAWSSALPGLLHWALLPAAPGQPWTRTPAASSALCQSQGCPSGPWALWHPNALLPGAGHAIPKPGAPWSPQVPTFRRVGVEPGVRACLGVGTALAKVVEPGRIEFKPGIRLRPLLAAHMRGHGAMESEGVGRQARRGSGIMACRRLGWRKRGVSLAAAPLFTCQSPGPWIVVVSDPRVARSLEIVTARGAGRLRWLSSARVQRPLLCSPSPLPARGEG